MDRPELPRLLERWINNQLVVGARFGDVYAIAAAGVDLYGLHRRL